MGEWNKRVVTAHSCIDKPQAFILMPHGYDITVEKLFIVGKQCTSLGVVSLKSSLFVLSV